MEMSVRMTVDSILIDKVALSNQVDCKIAISLHAPRRMTMEDIVLLIFLLLLLNIL
jgi:adenine C2-methylase RlmN of 23S rRNA A2503 and tRNA A37